MTFVIYEDTSSGTARVHRRSCRYVGQGRGGQMVDTPGSHKYHKGFETLEDAQRKAQSLGRRILHCPKCGF